MEVALGIFILLSKPENGGTCFTLVHCAQTKNILANEPSPQRCSMVQVSKKLEVALDMFSLLSEPENEGYCYTHVHCAQTKNILANEPSP